MSAVDLEIHQADESIVSATMVPDPRSLTVASTAYGSKVLGERLLRARLARGFRSAAAAASAHNWNANSYASLERGQRPISRVRAEEFGKAYGLPPEWFFAEEAVLRLLDSSLDVRQVRILEAGPLPAVGELAGNASIQTSSPHARLRAIRLLAGLANPAEAADTLGVARTTYHAHETGERRLTVQQARFYALALGAAFEWLRTGAGRSGLPVAPNWPETRWLGSLDDLADAPRPDRSRIAAAAIINSGRRIVELKAACLLGSEVIVDIPQVALDKGKFKVEAAWALPAAVLLSLPLAPDPALVAVRVEAVSIHGPGVMQGDYALVDIAPSNFGAGAQSAYAVGGRITAVPSDAAPLTRDRLGTILAALSPFR